MWLLEAGQRSKASLQTKICILLTVVFVLVCMCKSASDHGQNPDPDKKASGGASVVEDMILNNPKLMAHVLSSQSS